MAKIDITIDCSEVRICPVYSNKFVRVSLEDVFVNELLGSINVENIKDFLKRDMIPEDVFTNDELEEWAEQNGYTKA